MERFEIQTSECRGKIKKLSQNLQQQIDELEKATLSELADNDTKQRNETEQHIDTRTTALAKLNFDYQLFDSTPPTEKNTLFSHNLQLTKTIEHVEKALRDMDSEITKSNIDFEGDPTVMRAGAKSLGTVRITGMKGSRPVIAHMTVQSSTRSSRERSV